MVTMENLDCPLSRKDCRECEYFIDNGCQILNNLDRNILICIDNCQECKEFNCTLHPLYSTIKEVRNKKKRLRLKIISKLFKRKK